MKERDKEKQRKGREKEKGGMEGSVGDRESKTKQIKKGKERKKKLAGKKTR